MKYINCCILLAYISLANAQNYNRVEGEGNNPFNKKGFYFILYKNGNITDTIEGSFIKRRGHSENYIKSKKQIYSPNDIDSVIVYTKKKDITSDRMTAVSIDNMFLFNTVTGNIKCYNMVPYTDKKFSLYFQKDGALEYNTNYFRANTLKQWVQDDEESLQYWKKYRKRKMIRMVGPIAGVAGGLTLTTILSNRGMPDASGLAFVGTVFAGTLWFFIKPIHPSSIIDKYNANKRKNENFFQD